MRLGNMKIACVLGANGSMGAGCAAILAAFGSMKVYMLARDKDKAKRGMKAAVRSVRSETLEQRMEAGSYDEDLEKAVAQSDWVFECVAESYDIKENINRRINQARRPGTLLSTVTSGLSIKRLASCFDEDGRKHYYGTHFFNPPYKLTLCELVSHPENDPEYTQALSQYLRTRLMRHVIITNDTPAFAGNRIGFQMMNEAAQLAEQYQDQGGIYLLDSLLGPYTGRAMSPLATIDLVGLDVHKAIVDNIYENTKDAAHNTFRLPAYMQKLIAKGFLGNKSGKGLYCSRQKEDGEKERQVYHITKDSYEAYPSIEIPFKKEMIQAIRNADYQGGIEIFKSAKGLEADLLRRLIARYISYSFSLIPEVTDQQGIDTAMGFGFSCLAPSAWVDLLGGPEESCRFLEKHNMPIPPFFEDCPEGKFYKLQDSLDYRSLFRAA